MSRVPWRTSGEDREDVKLLDLHWCSWRQECLLELQSEENIPCERCVVFYVPFHKIYMQDHIESVHIRIVWQLDL